MKPLSALLLLLAAPAATLAQVNTPSRSPCWKVRRTIYNGSFDWPAKHECDSIGVCTYVDLTWGLPCAPTEFMNSIEPGACPNSVIEDQMYYLKGNYHSPDGCKWTNCLKNRAALCPIAVPDWNMPDDRKCAWHDGKCRQSVLTGELLVEKAALLAKAANSDAVALHRCAVDAMRENSLTASRPDFGCGASVLSPDCLTQVTAMGNSAVSCGKEALRSSVQAYYDDNLRWEVESTRELYDCVAEGIQQCPFSQREFCSSVRHLDWEIPSVANAKACVADFNCMVPHYNACARQAEFAVRKSLPIVRLSDNYQRAVDTQVCLKTAVTRCGGSMHEVLEACLEFTNVEACAANLRCYIGELGACGYENDLWDKGTAEDMIKVGPTITSNAQCFARELQGCGFHRKGGFCSNGEMRDFAAVGACLADFTCMAKAIAPCQAGQELLFEAARGVGGHKCKYVDEACRTYCGERVTSSHHNEQQCVLYCRIDGYVRCALLRTKSTYMSWRYDYNSSSSTSSWSRAVVVSDAVEQLACFEETAPACGFDEDTFCKVVNDATPTDAEAAACNVQTKCAAETLWTCLDKSQTSVVKALEKVADAAETTYNKHTSEAEATRACIEEKEVLCGAKMSSLGYNTALCLANHEACEERARCIVKEAHACGVQSGLLQSAAQDLLESTSYTRCMLTAPAFQGADLAQKVADLDYDFFFSPSSYLMRAHAKCAGWPLSRLTTILPDSVVDPARRQISSAEFCARSLTSVCEPLSFDPAAAAACALLATYRCRDGSAFNKKVDACFADAAGECGAVKGQKTWANVQGVDCVNDVVKCAEMAACLTAKTSTCLGTFLGGQAYSKLEQASSWTSDITERYLGWGKKAGGTTGDGDGDGGGGGSPPHGGGGTPPSGGSGDGGGTPPSGGSGDGGGSAAAGSDGGGSAAAGSSGGSAAAASDSGSGSKSGSGSGSGSKSGSGSGSGSKSGSGSGSGSKSGSESGSGSASGDGNAHKNAAPGEDKSSSTNLWIVVAAAGGGAIVAALIAVVFVKARATKAAPQWDTTMCTEEINVRDYEIPMIEEAVTLDAQASRHVETDPLTVSAVAE